MVEFNKTMCLTVLLWASSVSGAAAQTVMWENRGQPESSGAALDISAGGPVVFVTGNAGGPAGTQWFVRSLDRRTGATLWEDRFGPVIFGSAKDGAVEGERAFAAGWIFSPGLGYEFVTRAYDLQRGAVVWTRALARGSQCVEERPSFARCVAKALAVHDGRVFVVGHLTRTNARSDFSVLALDAATGAPLWESVTDPTGSGADDYAWGVAAHGGRVHVVGEVGNFSSLLVQSHDAATGAIQWQQHVPNARNFTLKDTIAAGGRGVFIGGFDGLGQFFVHAYDAATGALQWEDRVEGTGQVGALSVSGERLFAMGVVGCDPTTFLYCELAVRAYDLHRGLIWQRAEVALGGDWYATNVAVGAGQVIVGGNELLADGLYHPTVRSYKTADGDFEWAAYVDDELGHPAFGFTGFVNSILVRSDGVLVGGSVHRPDGGSDFLVRSYR